MTTRLIRKAGLPEEANVPPRSIWDPSPSGEDDEAVYYSHYGKSHGGGGGTGHDSDTTTTCSVRRRPVKHPAQMNEVELRIQLWDSYRLARIILGVPIRSVQLKSKTILHAIRLVAEMKLELIRVRSELKQVKLLGHPAADASLPPHEHHRHHQEDDENHFEDELTMPSNFTRTLTMTSTPDRKSATPSSPEQQQQQEPYLASPPRIFNKTRPLSPPTKSPPTRSKDRPADPMVQDMVLLYKPEVEDELEDVKLQYQALQHEHERFVTKTRDEIQKVLIHVQEDKARPQAAVVTPPGEAPPAVISCATDAYFSPTGLSPSRQPNQKGTLSSSPSKNSPQVEHQLERLYHTMEQVAEQTKEKIAALEQSIQESQKNLRRNHERRQWKDTAGVHELERRIRTQRMLNTLEFEAVKAKHSQQVQDLAGQLACYQEQVKLQQDELLSYRQRFHTLESLAVTPEQTKNVLQRLGSLSSRSTVEEQQQVQHEVVEVLHRLDQLQCFQDKDRSDLQQTLEAARDREKKTTEQMEDLKLQHEILLEETNGQGTLEEWKDQLAQQRWEYQNEITAILNREEKRLMDMECLEVQLNKLALLAVELEDCQHLFDAREEDHEAHIAYAKQRQGVAAQTMHKLQLHIARAVEYQQCSVKKLLSYLLKPQDDDGVDEEVVLHQNPNPPSPRSKEWQRRLYDLERKNSNVEEVINEKIQQPLFAISPTSTHDDEDSKRALQEKDAEIARLQEQLRTSQWRIRQLEEACHGKHHNVVVSIPPSSDGGTESTSPLSH